MFINPPSGVTVPAQLTVRQKECILRSFRSYRNGSIRGFKWIDATSSLEVKDPCAIGSAMKTNMTTEIKSHFEELLSDSVARVLYTLC